MAMQPLTHPESDLSPLPFGTTPFYSEQYRHHRHIKPLTWIYDSLHPVRPLVILQHYLG